MKRVLSIFLALAVVALVFTLIGLFTRTPRFAALRDGLGRQDRSVKDVLEESLEPEATLDA